MMIDQNLKTGRPTMKPDLYDIPPIRLKWDEKDTALFNEVYQYCLNLEEQGVMNRLTFTPSGGVSYTRENLYGAMFETRGTKNLLELIVRDVDGWWTRLMLGTGSFKVMGRTAYRRLCKELLKDGIDLTSYMITTEEGLQVKETISSPLICWYGSSLRNIVFERAHHIDLNSSYWAGITSQYPEFLPTIKRIYDLRKKNDTYKAILTHSQGYFQGKPLKYRLAQIAKAGIEWNNNTIVNLANAVNLSGRTVIAYNTDGFWYTGDPYHDDNEGTTLGQWKHDHVDCKLRFKSPGAYEYIEDGQYHPVLRGRTNLDEVKPRSEWEWGDIYQTGLKTCHFVENMGVIWLNARDI